MRKKATIIITLVPESKDVSNKQIEKEIKESLKCDWLAEVEKIMVKTEHKRLVFCPFCFCKS